MATGRDLIYAAFEEIGAFGAEETPPAVDVNKALDKLNRMWGGWNADLGTVYAETLDAATLIPGQTQYSYGAGGDFNFARPLKIIAAQLRYATNADVPVEVISFDRYQEISNKTSSADLILYLAYNPTFPRGTVFVWPVPTVAYSLRLTSSKTLAAFDLDTSLDGILPPGYDDAIVPNLAIRLAPSFGKSVSQLTLDQAQEAKANLLRANWQIEEMETDGRTPGMGRARKFNWRIG